MYLLLYFYCYNRKHAVYFVPCTCGFTFTVTIALVFVRCSCWFTFTVTIENTPYSCTLYLLLYFYCYNRKHALFFVPCTCWFTFTVTIENTPYSLYVVLVGLHLLLQQKTRLILCTLYLLVYFYCYNRKHALFFVPCTCCFTFTATIETRLILCTLYLLVYIYCYNRKHALFFVPCTCWFTFTVTIENTPYSLYLVLVALLLLLQQKTRRILCTLYLWVYFYCYNRKHAVFFVPCTCWFTFTVTIKSTPYSLYLVLVGLLLLLQQKTRLILCTLYLLLYFYCYNRKHALFFVPCTCGFTFTVTIEKHALFFVPCTCRFTFTVTIENTPYSLYVVLVGLHLLLKQKTRLILCTLFLLPYSYCYNRNHALSLVPCTCWFPFTVTIENTPYSLYLVHVALLLLLQKKKSRILCTLLGLLMGLLVLV